MQIPIKFNSAVAHQEFSAAAITNAGAYIGSGIRAHTYNSGINSAGGGVLR